MKGKKASRVNAHGRNPTPRNYDQDVVCCSFVGFELNAERIEIYISFQRNGTAQPLKLLQHYVSHWTRCVQ